MSDTNVLKFSLRERGWISTLKFDDEEMTEPGKVYLITCDPFGALIGNVNGVPYATALALTISRFRDFKYIGTRCSFVPVASTGQVDPAHVSQTLTSVPQNALHPRDVGNMVHWRRWTGGQFPVPHVEPANGSTYTEADAYNLDAAWLSDSRFNHVQVCDGFSFWARPLRSTIEAGGMVVNSFFGYQSSTMMGGYGSDTTFQQPRGQLAVSGHSVVPDTWIPNPFAGFTYSSDDSTVDPANPGYEITGIVPFFPWFSDTLNASSFVLETLLTSVRSRLMAPVAIVRMPPAYGSKYYWTIYMRHYFAVRRPWIVNSAWLAGKVEAYHPPVTAGGDSVPFAERGFLVRSPKDDIPLVQMIGPDPYGSESSPATLRMPESYVSIWAMQDESNASDDDAEEPVEEPVEEPAEEPVKEEPAEEPVKEVVKDD